MKKTIIASTLILFLGVLAGCSDQQQPAGNEAGDTSDQPEQQQTPSPDEQDGQEESEDGDEEDEAQALPSILSRISDLDSTEYDLDVTVPGGEDYTAHMWWKGPNMKVESTIDTQGGTFNSVYLLNTEEQTSTVYLPDQNRALEMGYSQAKEQTSDSPQEQNEKIREQNASIVDRETIDGKECVVVEYTSEQGNETRVWIWEEHGLPIKTVSETEDGDYITEMKNIEFGTVSDDEFELPEGVETMDIPGGMGF